jgi:hypothetical protein
MVNHPPTAASSDPLEDRVVRKSDPLEDRVVKK